MDIRIDADTIHNLATQVVAANLTTAIFSEVQRLQGAESYSDGNTDEAMGQAVKNVMNTYVVIWRHLEQYITPQSSQHPTSDNSEGQA
jgi:hypothetical protein